MVCFWILVVLCTFPAKISQLIYLYGKRKFFTACRYYLLRSALHNAYNISNRHSFTFIYFHSAWGVMYVRITTIYIHYSVAYICFTQDFSLYLPTHIVFVEGFKRKFRLPCSSEVMMKRMIIGTLVIMFIESLSKFI